MQPYRDSIGKVKLRIYKKEGNGNEVKTAYGTFFLVNRGEWGGGLYYKPYRKLPRQFYINGSSIQVKNNPWAGGLLIKDEDPLNKIIKQSVLIKNGNAAGIIYHQNQIYFIEELLHMMTSKGALYKLRAYKDSVRIDLIEAFNSAPMLLSSFLNKMYLVTADRLYTI